MLLMATNTACIYSYVTSNRIEKNLDSTKEANKKQMLLANNDMSDRLRVLKENSKLEFLNEFGKYWRIKLQEIKSLESLKLNINKDFESLCPLFFFGLYFAFIDLLYPLRIFTIVNVSIYPSHIGWLFIMVAIVLQSINQFGYRGLHRQGTKYYNVTRRGTNLNKIKVQKKSSSYLSSLIKALKTSVLFKRFKPSLIRGKKIKDIFNKIDKQL